MKISEKCKIDIENLIEARNTLKTSGAVEPYSFVMWGRDFASILELYTAYKLLVDENDKLKTENERLREKVGELHTIKKSFEVLRALYLGDYENDEPF